MKIIKTLAIAAAVTAAGPAFAQTLGGGGCITDLNISGGSSIINCYGRLSGNTLNNNGANNTANNAALTALGYTGPAIAYNSIAPGNILTGLGGAPGTQVINFPGLLNGTAYVGIHYGNGQGGPGNSTTFYAINALNLDSFILSLGASSTATLFAQVAAPVPEPATWAMMLAGFGALGFALRRRSKTSTRVRYA